MLHTLIMGLIPGGTCIRILSLGHDLEFDGTESAIGVEGQLEIKEGIAILVNCISYLNSHVHCMLIHYFL